MKRILYIIPTAMLLLASCASSQSAYTVGGEWQVTNMNGKNITPSNETPFIGFDRANGNLYGFTGCNRLTGTADLKKLANGKVDFKHVGMTQMLCPDDVYESEFMEALNQAVSMEMKGNEMLLKNKQGKTILTLKKK